MEKISLSWHLVDSGVSILLEDISWERIFMRMVVRVLVPEGGAWRAEALDYYAVYRSGKARAQFAKKKLEDDRWELALNVSNNGENQCVPNGIYTIYACQGTDVLAECRTSVACAKQFASWNKAFPYMGGSYAYTISFFAKYDGASDWLPFRMNVRNLQTKGQRFPENVHPAVRIKRLLVKKYKDVGTKVRTFYEEACARNAHHREKGTILLLTSQNDTLVNNLAPFYQRLLERKMDERFPILIYAKNTAGIPKAKVDWKPLAEALSKARYVFLDDHVPALDWIKLHKDTELIQLWHAGGGFKSTGYNRWGGVGGPRAQSCHRQYTYGIVNARQLAPIFAEAWGIDEAYVIPAGMPRMDSYLEPSYKEVLVPKLYEQFPLCQGKKVILFAPTFRGTNNSTGHYPYEYIDLKALYEACGDEWVVLFKNHPWVRNSLELPEAYADKFLDVQSYPRIDDLFYITDLMITDYSSAIYEYSLQEKPMLFYAFDLEKYSFTRAFHRDYESTIPGKLCRSWEQVIAAIQDKDFEEEKVHQYVKDHFDFMDSHASDRIIDWFLLGELPEEFAERIRRRKEELERLRCMDFTTRPIDK